MTKYYKVPVYKASTSLKRLENCGNIIVRRTILSTREILTEQDLDVLDSKLLEKINRNLYISDKSTIFNYTYAKEIKATGFYLCILQRDLKDKNLVTANDIESYISDYEHKEFKELYDASQEIPTAGNPFHQKIKKFPGIRK